jgi:hypothetical protein
MNKWTLAFKRAPGGFRRALLAGLLVLSCCLVLPASAATGKVIKVLPQFLDLKGRHALSPSLFDRDAYQAQLRANPLERSGLRFAVQWKSKGRPLGALKLRLEARGVSRGSFPKEVVLEKQVPSGNWFSSWTSFQVTGEAYRELGEVTSWRATLWEEDRLIGEQKSFLW